MKVAENYFDIENAPQVEPVRPREQVYASQRTVEGETTHDARGLVVAVLMSLVCWAALGYYLLT